MQKVLDELTLNITSAAPAAPTKVRVVGRIRITISYLLFRVLCACAPTKVRETRNEKGKE